MKSIFVVLTIVIFSTSCTTRNKKILYPSGTNHIVLERSDGKVIRVSKSELTRAMKTKTLLIRFNPAYQGLSKKYHGYSFKDFLHTYDPKSLELEQFWVEVTTHDGWKAPLYSSVKLLSGNAILATYEDESSLTEPKSEDGKWSLVQAPKKLFYPGPYYLVWNDNEKNPDIMPLQIQKIKVLSKSQTTSLKATKI